MSEKNIEFDMDNIVNAYQLGEEDKAKEIFIDNIKKSLRLDTYVSRDDFDWDKYQKEFDKEIKYYNGYDDPSEIGLNFADYRDSNFSEYCKDVLETVLTKFNELDPSLQRNPEIVGALINGCFKEVIPELYSKLPESLKKEPQIIEMVIEQCSESRLRDLYRNFEPEQIIYLLEVDKNKETEYETENENANENGYGYKNCSHLDIIRETYDHEVFRLINKFSIAGYDLNENPEIVKIAFSVCHIYDESDDYYDDSCKFKYYYDDDYDYDYDYDNYVKDEIYNNNQFLQLADRLNDLGVDFNKHPEIVSSAFRSPYLYQFLELVDKFENLGFNFKEHPEAVSSALGHCDSYDVFRLVNRFENLGFNFEEHPEVVRACFKAFEGDVNLELIDKLNELGFNFNKHPEIVEDVFNYSSYVEDSLKLIDKFDEIGFDFNKHLEVVRASFRAFEGDVNLELIDKLNELGVNFNEHPEVVKTLLRVDTYIESFDWKDYEKVFGKGKTFSDKDFYYEDLARDFNDNNYEDYYDDDDYEYLKESLARYSEEILSIQKKIIEVFNSLDTDLQKEPEILESLVKGCFKEFIPELYSNIPSSLKREPNNIDMFIEQCSERRLGKLYEQFDLGQIIYLLEVDKTNGNTIHLDRIQEFCKEKIEEISKVQNLIKEVKEIVEPEKNIVEIKPEQKDIGQEIG